MKRSIAINYYIWADKTFEVHIYCTDSEYMVVMDGSTNPHEWRIQNVDFDGPADYCVPVLPNLPEEVHFQESVIWDRELDFYLVHAIQKYVLENQPSWDNKEDALFSVDLEY